MSAIAHVMRPKKNVRSVGVSGVVALCSQAAVDSTLAFSPNPQQELHDKNCSPPLCGRGRYEDRVP